MPNNVNTNVFSATYVDYSGESASFTVGTRSLADNAAYAAARLALLNAVADVSLGALQQRSESLNTILVPYVSNSTDPLAKRELKILVSYQDEVTGKRNSFTIPCIDEAAVTFITNSDEIDMTGAAAAALVTAIEAFVASPAGNTIQVYKLERVGRNN